MKTVSTLLLAYALIGSVNAQVAMKTQQTSTNKHSTSSSAANSNKNSSARSSVVTHKTTYKSNVSDKTSPAKTSSDFSYSRVANLDANQNTSATRVSNIEIKNTEVKETPKGEIKKVDTEPQIYLEDKKDEETAPSNGTSNSETIPYPEDNTKKAMPEGLSQNTTTLKNNGIRINGVIVTCDDFSIGRNRRWEILSRFEMYDLSMVKRCNNSFPKDDRWLITCDEFEKSDDARKMYILNNLDFYNLDNIQDCESYKTFKANLPVESEE